MLHQVIATAGEELATLVAPINDLPAVRHTRAIDIATPCPARLYSADQTALRTVSCCLTGGIPAEAGEQQQWRGADAAAGASSHTAAGKSDPTLDAMLNAWHVSGGQSLLRG